MRLAPATIRDLRTVAGATGAHPVAPSSVRSSWSRGAKRPLRELSGISRQFPEPASHPVPKCEPREQLAVGRGLGLCQHQPNDHLPPPDSSHKSAITSSAAITTLAAVSTR